MRESDIFLPHRSIDLCTYQSFLPNLPNLNKIVSAISSELLPVIIMSA
jgi:hypothetical protein